MNQLAKISIRSLIAILTFNALAACAEVAPNEHGPNSAQEARASMPSHADRPSPSTR